MRADLLTAPLLVPGTLAQAQGAESGTPRDYEDALEVLAGSAAVLGLLDDRGEVRVLAEPVVQPAAPAPRSLEDLVRDQGPLSDADDHPGRVRVVEVRSATGSSWLVEVSGTQVWDPRAGPNPCDVTTDVRAMAGESTVLARGVQEALEQAQAQARTEAGAEPDRDPSVEPVMLVGHSLGGIVAAGLAASPVFTARHRVTHVVTMGSPVARMPVPAGVEVLSLEHRQDPVPRLEGAANPDRAGWVTATRDLDGRERRASAAHGVGEYAATAAAVDRSTDPSLVAWREGSRGFLAPGDDAQVVVRDYRIARGPAASVVAQSAP
jgi:hypothetical protein